MSGDRHRARSIQFVFRRSEGDRALAEGIAFLALYPPSSLEVDEAEVRLRIDSWGMWMFRSTLERFAHDFLTHGRAVDARHDYGPIGAWRAPALRVLATPPG